MIPSLSIIGCGRVGKTLGYLLSHAGLVTIHSLYSRRLNASAEALKFIQQGSTVSNLAAILPSDFYLIAVPDDDIAAVSQHLFATAHIPDGATVFHTSGALPSEILKISLGEKNRGQIIHTASMHPILSFHDATISIQHFSGCYCTIEGDIQACQYLKRLFEHIGATIIEITPATKIAYHAGLVFASNLLVGLVDQAIELLQQAGIDEGQSRDILKPILMHTVHNLCEQNPYNALTGPVQRGDMQTILSHINHLQNHPSLLNTYIALSTHLLALLSKKQVLSDNQKTIGQLLTQHPSLI